jgi:predicted phage tail protein
MQNDIIIYDVDTLDTKILDKSYIVEGSMGKGGKKAYVPFELPDTKVSSQVVRLLIAVSEGVCEELTDVLFNYVPASNYNCTIEWRDGTSNQSVIAGFEDARNPSPTFIPFSNMTTAGLYLASVDWHANSVIVTLTTSLMRDLWDSGDIVMSNAIHEIWVRASPASTWTRYYVSNIWAKVSSPWSWDIRVPAPTGVIGGTNWEIKLVRTSPNDATAKKESKVSWTALTEIVELTLNYPNTALVGITLWDAAQFGGQIPDILFRIKGIKVRLPDNYDPIARTYVSAWSGTPTLIILLMFC